MNMQTRIMIFITLVLFNLTSYATIYQQGDVNGNITYSDSPLNSNATIVSPPASTGSTTTPVVNPGSDVSSTATEVEASTVAIQNYLIFMIDSPKNNETIQNQPVIPVEIKLDPALQEGDQIQLILDEKPWGKSVKGTRLELDGVERGTHQLYAVMMNKDNQIKMKSNVITIYVHRNSVVTSPTRPRPN
jgi:hypothetical protein